MGEPYHRNRLYSALYSSTPSKQQKRVVFRILCWNDRVECLTGNTGTNIYALEEESGARIVVGPTVTDCDERLVTVSSKEDVNSSPSAAQNALKLVFSTLADAVAKNGLKIGSNKISSISARLLVPSNQVGCLLGNGDTIISEMRKATGANIRVLKGEPVPKCASEDDQVVEITGQFVKILDAVYQVTKRLRSNLFRSNITSVPESQKNSSLLPPDSSRYEGVSDLPISAPNSGPRNLTLHVQFNVEDHQPFSDDAASGFIRGQFGDLERSYLKVRYSHIENLEELVEFSNGHRSLLSVVNAVVDVNGVIYLETEKVESVEHFFWSKYQNLPENGNWWNEIEPDFWVIFRDVVQGLIYLFQKGAGCGELRYDIYVNRGGSGRILPSLAGVEAMNGLKYMKELKDLKNLMLRILRGVESDGFLPQGLKDFFTTIDQANMMMNSAPPTFLIDHPYFMTVAEKINFTLQLRKFLKFTLPSGIRIEHAFDNKLQAMGLYGNWNETLTGVYAQIFAKPQTVGHIQPYTRRSHLIRFFNAVYTHHNDDEYIQYRIKNLEKDEIEEELIKFYPHFYTHMFACLCDIIKSHTFNKVGDFDLKLLSSVYQLPESRSSMALRSRTA